MLFLYSPIIKDHSKEEGCDQEDQEEGCDQEDQEEGCDQEDQEEGCDQEECCDQRFLSKSTLFFRCTPDLQ